MSAGYCVLDVVFVVDLSSSIRENEPPGVNNLDLIKSFLKQLLNPPMEVRRYFDQIGLVMFQSSARMLFDLDDRTTVQAVGRGIDLLPHPDGETNPPAAINLARQVGLHGLYQ